MLGFVCDRISECDGWKRSYSQINDAVICKVEVSGKPYTGVPFTFCPWCGKEIKWEEWNRKITGQTEEKA